ncbi:LamG-like jellyroll fold domain-containing protein [Lysinibacillus louembei]|uniref:LamG-like jellyroll fold domain-containing protein n=1 Tax=Lysinibacillus louembei TaxID=1470088 RepID=A0ABZ0RYC6_9BACI|nr:LamG-like jellyroll fold domain-containing protein [Lysinibacillus louembei]WPK11823.1 LamG-like jellyroll fold domain-containing protein [Lysinibacillus louembei]
MANSKDNLNKYGKAFIGFDEVSGNVLDSIGGYTGTLYNNPQRVIGWDGQGNAMSFNGINQYIQMNSTIIPYGNKTIRFKYMPRSIASQTLLLSGGFTLQKGIQISHYANKIRVDHTKGVNGQYEFSFSHSKEIEVGKWHDIIVYFDFTKKTLGVSVNSVTEIFTIMGTEHTPYSDVTFIGVAKNSSNILNYLNGQLDQIEIYDKVISPIPDKHLVQHNTQHKYHNGISWQTITPTEENFIQYGMNNLNHITEAQWQELAGDNSIVMWSDFEDKQYASVVLNKEPFTAKDLLGDNPQVIYYTDSDASQIIVETEVDPYSVYDYIGELPTILAYTESTEDIIVSTTTEPFDIYDEFGDEVEVLYYTDDEAVNEADLILEANWSPLDELEGDFEVVTWTDEAPETAQRVLEIKAVPKPQFIKLVNPKRLYGYLEDVFVNDISQSYRDEARYFVTDTDTSSWYVWDNETEAFIEKDTFTEQAISVNGMKYHELNAVTDKQWKTWNKRYLNIGVFLKDNPRDTIVSIVENVSYKDYLPRNTTTISDTSLYILNTTAKIDIELNGNTLKGILSDADLTRVQYRVLLNNKHYFPDDGSFTKLGESPQNIELAISSKDIHIDDWNTLKVEFQDFFGTTDYWSTQFIGTYSGLMFKDVYGQYYSSEIGEVLQYLDFGVIIAGQTTIEHEVILKNQYGYDVKDVHLYANTTNFPTGMTCEFSTSLSPFTPHPELRLNKVLKNNEEFSFFVRLKSELGATPDANGSFDIIVRAEKA